LAGRLGPARFAVAPRPWAVTARGEGAKNRLATAKRL